jgi:PTH1 family peptidyl-tRNA hydrolase
MVVGLGNPGDEYAGTRHNVGFEVLDRLARERSLLFESPRGLEGYTGPRKASVALSMSSERSDARSARRTLFVRPMTYMNLSGTVVAPLARWAGLEPERVLVVVDDLDLPLGKLRIRPHGGTGGHNGLRSIVECLGTDRFPRLRVGIGNPGTDAARHVLERFTRPEREEMDVCVAEAAEAIDFWLESGDIEECMARFHSRWNQASP